MFSEKKTNDEEKKSTWTEKFSKILFGIFLVFGLIAILNTQSVGFDEDACVYKEDGVMKENAEWYERFDNATDAERTRLTLECMEAQERVMNSMSDKEKALWLLSE